MLSASIFEFVSFNMKKLLLKFQLFFILIYVTCASNLSAEVYGGGNWEAIGLGNMTCEEFVSKTNEDSYKELAAVWLSGFMSGVNFTSQDVYDITWGEDLYVLTDLVIKRCTESSEKYLSDVATEMVHKRYKNQNFTSKKDLQDQ